MSDSLEVKDPASAGMERLSSCSWCGSPPKPPGPSSVLADDCRRDAASVACPRFLRYQDTCPPRQPRSDELEAGSCRLLLPPAAPRPRGDPDQALRRSTLLASSKRSMSVAKGRVTSSILACSAINASCCSSSFHNRRNRKRWCSVRCPSSAFSSSGIFPRSWRRARSAIWAGSFLPSSMASIMARPDPHYLTGHRSQHDVCIFQYLFNSVAGASFLFYQLDSVAGEIAQLALGRRGNQAAFQQSMLQQLRNPLAVANVTFAPGHRFR
jgi:hypothetical protein